MWFERLVGFEEGTMDNVRSKLELDGSIECLLVFISHSLRNK